MKKQITLATTTRVVCACLAAIMSAAARADHTAGIDGTTWSYKLSSGNATITAVAPAGGALIVPSEIDGHPVTAIGKNVGKGDAGITSLRIPDSVTMIDGGAFTFCKSLREVVLGDGVTAIGGYSSSGTSTGSNNNNEKYGAFAGCTALTNIVFGASLRSIGNQSFTRCTSLTELILPDTLTSLGVQCFYGSTNICEVSIGTGLSSMGEWAFGKCRALQSVVFRPCDTQKLAIAESAFRGCTKLEGVTLSEAVTGIGAYAFRSCPALKRIDIPDSVKTIGRGAFAFCTSLGEVVLGDGVTTIYGHSTSQADTGGNNIYEEDGAFAGCTGLTNIVFGSSLRSIRHQCFRRCTSLPRLDLPDTVTSLGVQCFYGATSLRELSIGTGLSSMGEWAFGKCTALQNVVFRPCDTPRLSIGESAFRSCAKLESVELPNSVTNIGAHVFKSCSALKRIDIPDSVENIGWGAFTYCASLGEVVLGNGLMHIQGCSHGYDVGSSNGYADHGAFSACPSLTNIVFGSSLQSISGQCFGQCTSLSKLVFPDSLNSIGTQCFYGCTSLTDVVLGNGLTSIGAYAFWKCPALRSLNVGTAMGTFDKYAFSECPSLRYIFFHGLRPPTLGSNVFKNAPAAMVVYAADGGFGWDDGDGDLPEKWNGWTIKWGSDYSPNADAPYDFAFTKPAAWEAPLLLCDSPDGTAPQDVFLAGEPIYARYAFRDAWVEENIVSPFANGIAVVRGGDPADEECIWRGVDEIPSYQIGSTVLRTVRMDGVEVGPAHRIDVALDSANAVAETDEGNNAASCTFAVIPSVGIAFISEGVEVARRRYAAGGTLTALPEPSRRIGFAFSGWFTNEDHGTPISVGDDVPEGDTSFYAHWDIRPTQTNHVSGTITGDAVWEMGDLYVVDADLTVASGARLTIEAGVIVKFAAGKSLVVKKGGTLSAIGTRALPVIFTSIRDDSAGGDTNGDGNTTSPQAGDWHQIKNSGTATLDYARALYCSALNNQGALYPCAGTMTFRNSTIAHCLYDCMRGAGGTFLAENSVFADASMGVAPQSGKSTFVNCVLYSLTTAVRWGNGTFANCILADIAQDVIDTKFHSSSLKSKFSNCCFWAPDATGDKAAAKIGKDGNIWAKPLFVNPERGDFRLAANSPCVDAGDGSVAPELDYYGKPRMNVDAVRPTGWAGANGAVPDVGIYEVPGDGNIPAPDLTVTSVTAPATLTVGESVEIAWTVENIGDEPAGGAWRDEIEIVAANGQVFPMGTSAAQAEIRPGASANFHATVAVPAAPEGSVQVRVTANKYQDLFEAMKADNNAGESVAKLAAPALAVPTDGGFIETALQGDSDYGFALDGGGAVATQGGVLVIRGAGELDAWLGNGSIAAKDNAIRTSVKIADDTWLLQIPAGSQPRVTVRNDGEGAVATQLSLEVGGFFLVDVGKMSAANSGIVTVPFAGNGFNDSLVCWLERGGVRIDAADLKVENGVSAFAMFDVTDCEAGDWTLHVRKGADEASATLLKLTESRIGAKWNCKVNVAATVRAGRIYTGSVEYGNSGDTAMSAPYLHLTANSGTLIRLTEADAWTDSIELLAISDSYPASSLKPGESGKVEFFYKTSAKNVRVACDITTGDASAFPWDTNAAYMRPSWATDEMWGIALATLKANIGTTWNGFLDRMRTNADYLMKIGRTKASLGHLWQMEVNEALGTDWAIQTLASGTDLVRSGRGMGISFSRTYGSSMSSRLRASELGYGWRGNFSQYAELLDSTTLAVHLSSGSSYQFTKVSGSWKPEDARDKTQLDESTTDYVLTYKDGTLQTIAKSNMRTSSIRDNQGNELTFTYNGNQLTKVAHTDGQSLTFTYSGDKVASVTDDQGRTVRYDYTGDLLTSVTAFNGLVTRYVYHEADTTPLSRALTQIVYPDGTTKDYTYDTQGRVATTSVNGNQFTTEIVRTGGGSYAVVAPNGGVTEVTVGAKGNVPRVVNALGQTVKQKYSDTGLLEGVIAPSGKRSNMSYNTDGQLVAASSASGAETAFAYEPDFDNLASVTDAKGHAISYGYDELGRGNAISYVDGSSSTLEYNERGDVVKSTNRRGESIAYEYDAEGNLTKKTWPDGRTFTMEYDAKGNVTTASDSETGTVTMEYDANERLTRIVYPKDRGFTYKYDAVGRMTERASLDGSKECFTYDALGRLATVKDGDGNAYLTNAYDPTTGWLVTQTYGNGTVVSNAYDILGRTVGIYHLKGGERMAFFEYAYDADGKCISQTTAEGEEKYTYDADGQLIGVAYPDGATESFAYDAVGNRITANDVAYTVNDLNQYTQIGGTSLEYDADGNMTRNGDTYYTYDVLNRLVAVTDDVRGIYWSCEYDVFGNRVRVTDNGTTTEKVYLQGSLPSVAAEYVDDALVKRHVLVGAVRVADVAATPSSSRYYHADMLGSARLLTDGTGEIKGTRSFKAFGATRTYAGETTDAGYVGTLGVETDSTGLLFMRNRYYSTGIGRFIQVDSIGLRAGDVNEYRYCGNDVVCKVDVSGNFSLNPVKWVYNLGYCAGLIYAGTKIHYKRDKFNTNIPTRDRLNEQCWKKLPPKQSVAHMMGENGRGNTKYVSCDGLREVVYRENGDIDNSDENRGTYNYFDPTSEPLEHICVDYITWLFMGNSPTSTNKGQRWGSAFTGAYMYVFGE